MRILISRTDSIGDVMLTLPLATFLKRELKAEFIAFLGKSYTQPIIEACPEVDQFLNIDTWEKQGDLSVVEEIKHFDFGVVIHVFPNKLVGQWTKKAEIPKRIGTSHRLHHWMTCNIRPNFTRKNSDKHEAVLNFELLRPLGVRVAPTFEEINEKYLHFDPQKVTLPTEVNEFIANDAFFVLHPKSQGSALEWPMDHYLALAMDLTGLGKKVIFTGTEAEGREFRQMLPQHPLIFDSTGKLSLVQLMQMIRLSEGLVACSTGPLHIAGQLNRRAVGLFVPKKPIHPGRWRPLGNNVRVLVDNENCPICKEGRTCLCIQSIAVERVRDVLLES